MAAVPQWLKHGHKHAASERDTDFRVFRMDTITKVLCRMALFDQFRLDKGCVIRLCCASLRWQPMECGGNDVSRVRVRVCRATITSNHQCLLLSSLLALHPPPRNGLPTVQPYLQSPRPHLLQICAGTEHRCKPSTKCTQRPV